MKTAIVILNWNGRHFLEKYLPVLESSVNGIPGVSIVVADNASADGSVEFLQNKFPGVKVIAFDRNWGFATGYNKALNMLQDDCFVLLNSDIEVSQDWFYPLQEWMELHPDCGICAPKLHEIGERDRFEYAGAAGGYIDRFGYPLCRGRVMGRTEKDIGQYDTPCEVFWASGAALMIRSGVYFSLGGLCDEFFAHMEEIDLCWRARLDGWKVNVVPRSVVWHVGGGTLPADSPAKAFLNHRNNLLMLQRNLPLTIATGISFNVAARAIDPDEGPDMFENCCNLFLESDKKMKKDWIASCVDVALIQTRSTIRIRKCLDLMSAAVYFVRGRKEFAKAVFRAHREFSALKKEPDEKQLRHFLREIMSGTRTDIARTLLTDNPGEENLLRGRFALKGMWSKWMVWQSLSKKDAIFAKIRNNIV